jgi:hypothetical protein
MSINLEENNEKSEEINENINIEITKNYSKQKYLSNNDSNTKKEKKKRNKRTKIEKSKSNVSSKSNNNFIGGILSEIKQISIPNVLDEKENLFKILQSEIINIDRGIALLNKKKKYYDEIIQKLGDEIQNEKKNIKKTEIKNKEYIYMENELKDIDINETFENIMLDNSYYNINKVINENLDYNYFLLNQKNNKNFLIINFFDEKNISKINNKMEPNFQMTYEEFNNIGDMEDNYCILMNNDKNDNKENEINSDKNEDSSNENKIIIDSESEKNNNLLNLVDNTPLKENKSEQKEEFTIINEVPAEEEETNNKKRKKISMNNSSNNKKDDKNLDRNINKDYSNSVEELDFYLLKDSNNIEKKEQKKKITKEDIEKKYKTQDMGSGFLSSDSSSLNLDNSKEIQKKKKKKPRKNKKESAVNSKSDKSDVGIISSNNDNEEELPKDKNDVNSIEISNDKSEENNDEENYKKKKKRKRKKKKEVLPINFVVEEEYPDPENLDNTALCLEMKKYGMKPQNKKKNIEILKSVYKFLKIKEMPDNIFKNLTTFDCDNNENISEDENENLTGSKKNENISGMNELNEETKKKIIEIIKENKFIYEKILLFKEVSIKEIKNILNSKGIIVPNQLLSQLLINSGVVLPGGWNNKK